MNNRDIHTFILPDYIPVYFGRQDFVIAYAQGKKVLHLGCVDQHLAEEKYKKGIYMHARLHDVCADLWGIDIDEDGIRWMEQNGWTQLLVGNIEDLSQANPIFQQEFDLLVLSEVIEHLDNPGLFLNTIRPLFQSQTELLITTPNAMRLQNIFSNFRKEEKVHPDHNYWYSYRTLTRLLNKHGYEVLKTAVYTQGSYHRLLAGRLFKPPLQPTNSKNSGFASRDPSTPPGVKRLSLVERIKRNAVAFIHGSLLQHNPFFADGLIMITKPSQNTE